MGKASKESQLGDLQRIIEDIEKVRIKPRMSPKFKSWHRETLETLERVFGRKSRQVKDFENIRYNLATFSNKTPESKFEEAFQQGLMSAAVMLSAAAKDLKKGDVGSSSSPEPKSVLEQRPAPSIAQSAAPPKPAPAPAPAAPAVIKEPPAIVKRAMAASSNKIFLVYANDIGMKGDVSTFLSKMGVSTIVLKDSADSRTSLIDELEKHDQVHYAIVMLNPDASGISENIVYELGLIVGRLGKNRVCGLVKEYISILANYSGISYVPVDPAGAWRFLLIKQLKDAGFNIDANLAL